MKLIIGNTKVDKGIIKLTFSLLLIILFFVGIHFIPCISFAQTQQTKNVTSNVTIAKQIAISRSTNLTAGILFGTVTIGSNNNNATGNFNSTGHTQFWITIDSTTTVPIDLCIRANDSMRSGSYSIPLTNYHWSYNTTTNNQTYPTYPATTDMTTTFDYVDNMNDTWNQGTTVYCYFRFNLDIPSGQVAGTYTNEISFKATENTTTC